MTPSWRCWWWKLGLASWLGMGGAIASLGDCALAQITPDGTLGAESSVVTPTNIDGHPTERIDGGATRGANLFHSFREFSVPTGGTAYFNNSLDIQNIISRVTGGSVSNIDGLLRANSTANLFLLNPNGIIFGPNASLNIGGSFLGSTASSVNFADGTQFSATTPQTTPLLTVSVPQGLQFGLRAGGIRVQGSGAVRNPDGLLLNREAGLSVQPEESLALVGSGVALEGGILTTAGGRIELGSVASPGLVSLTPTDTGWALGYEEVPTFGDIHLSGAAAVDASGAGGDDIQVRGRRVTLQDGSQTEVSALGGELGGTLNVIASESVEVIGRTADGQNSSFLSTAVQPGATGAGGNLTIETGRLIVRDGAQVAAGTFGEGAAGTLAVRVSESVEVIGTSTDSEEVPSGLFTSVQEGATGAGGNLTIETGRLIVRDGAGVSAETLGEGAAGKLTIKARESVEVIGESADGKLGSLLSTQTYGARDAGDLILETERLLITDGAQVTASTLSSGRAGMLVVSARESVELMGTSPVFGDQFPSSLSTQTEGVGDAADLRIDTGQLIVRDGAQVTVSSLGSGKAGNLQVQARSIKLNNQGDIDAITRSGNGGDITLRSQDLVLLRNNSNISTTTGNAGAGGNGGNITIDTPFIVAVPEENSDITANAFSGGGGRVTIEANGIFGIAPLSRQELQGLRPEDLDPLQLPTNDITAISRTNPSLSGIVEINTPDVDPARGLATLPAGLVEASGLIATGCGSGGRQGESKFIITGRGELPIRPTDAHISYYPTGTVRSIPSSSPSSETPRNSDASSDPSINPISNDPTPIVEAQGWVINNKGDVVLTAHAPNVTSHIPWLLSATCHTP